MAQGQINKGDKLYLIGTGTYCEALEVGYLRPSYVASKGIPTGDIGYVVTGLKDLENVRVGDTVTLVSGGMEKTQKQLPGYAEVTPVVFAGIFSTDSSDYVLLRKALTKLKINDSSLIYEPKHSDALGFGFHCGFLGLLHMEIVQERLEREFDLDLIITAPSVSYQVVMSDSSVLTLSSPSEMPQPGTFHEVREPWVKAEIVVPKDYVGNVMKLCEEKDGIYLKIDYIDESRVVLDYELPLRTIVLDFYDNLKSATSGYASFSYDILGYRKGDLVKMDIYVAGDIVDSLSLVVPKKYVQSAGRAICKKLKDVIPKHMFRVSLQAAVGGKFVAREDISAMSKDVTAKLYGGDVTRKNKLRKKQAKGKKRMKQFGKVQIPQKAFLSLLDRG
jgi:GTP-binding protein LepA